LDNDEGARDDQIMFKVERSIEKAHTIVEENLALD
jgi:hypothetical protein